MAGKEQGTASIGEGRLVHFRVYLNSHGGGCYIYMDDHVPYAVVRVGKGEGDYIRLTQPELGLLRQEGLIK